MSHIIKLTWLLLTTAVICSCKTLYIANSTEWCEGDPDNCYTLDQLTAELANREYRNLTLRFCPGRHFLSQELAIDRVEGVEMIGSPSKSIIWIQETDLVISNAKELKIEDMIFLSNSDTDTPGFVNIDDCSNVLLRSCTFRGSAMRISSNYATMTGCTLEHTLTQDTYKRGVTISTNYYLHIHNSVFVDNKIYPDQQYNAVDISFDKLAHIDNSTFIDNYGQDGGGIKLLCYSAENLVYITNCKFTGNHADKQGGAILIPIASNITIVSTTFESNSAQLGGAIHILRNMHLKIVDCTFIDNHATDERSSGAIFMDTPEEGLTGTLLIKNTVFKSNSGTGTMSILRRIGSIQNTNFTNNNSTGNYHKILTIMQSTITLRQVVFSQNRGFIYTFNSQLSITGPVTFRGNVGGAVNAVQSQVSIDSTVLIYNNTANLGGGITLRESELFVRSPITITNNTATTFGGGIYAFQSTIDFTSDQKTGESFIYNNFAGQNGGGVYAVASTIKLSRSFVTIGLNTALLSGGGLYLQESSKLYLLKQSNENWESPRVALRVTDNTALYGGGIFVADNSTAGELQCSDKNLEPSGSPTITSECFLQTVRLYPSTGILNNMANTFIINNTAETGSALYGGLLDRCSVNNQAEVFWSANALEYFKWTATISEGSTITSDPLQVVFCDKESLIVILTRKGEPFKINISAIDQVGNPVKATIQSSVVTKSGVGRLKEGQAQQRVGDQCTEIEYSVFSQDSSANVELYADGPCANLGISKQTIIIIFLPCKCPIGLQPSKSEIVCECVCDEELRPHQITNCSQKAGTIQLETNIWIGVANSTNGTGYIIHDCPFDYCVEKPVNISLESQQERNKQCALNRSGFLCGECQQRLSLVLATSKCKECSNVYLLLLLPFALAGIALIGFILFSTSPLQQELYMASYFIQTFYLRDILLTLRAGGSS